MWVWVWGWHQPRTNQRGALSGLYCHWLHMSHIYANIVQFQIQICKLVFVHSSIVTAFFENRHCDHLLYAAIKLGICIAQWFCLLYCYWEKIFYQPITGLWSESTNHITHPKYYPFSKHSSFFMKNIIRILEENLKTIIDEDSRVRLLGWVVWYLSYKSSSKPIS